MERLWSKVWQVACRAEELRHAGDHVLYQIGAHSLIIVRSETDQIRGFYNACLHRGTQLRVEGGTVSQFRCPFHGFTWNLQGELTAVPTPWDFPSLDRNAMTLPEVKVDVWGGFVFVNLDPDAHPLEEFLEILPEHLEPFGLDRRYKAVHVSQIVPCNWKVALEAFFEGLHVPCAHPQTVRTYDAAVQYDVWPGVRHTSRLIQLGAAASPLERDSVEESEILDWFQQLVPPAYRKILEDGERARPLVAAQMRWSLGRLYGVDLSGMSEADLLDQVQYFIFPNVIPWPTVGAPLVYRFRPVSDDPNESLMEVYYLHPLPEGVSEPMVSAEIRLAPGAHWASVGELGPYGPVFDQDMPNLSRVQLGLRTTRHSSVHLSTYQESRLAHFHRTLDEYVLDGQSSQSARVGS
jgi:phenylpropionate dioxygenase-like ring-hydroxylating dioxygenase large terminal subunit